MEHCHGFEAGLGYVLRRQKPSGVGVTELEDKSEEDIKNKHHERKGQPVLYSEIYLQKQK